MKPNNIMKIDYTDIIPMVALYDANSITEEKVKELIYSDEYDKRVIIMMITFYKMCVIIYRN